MIAATASPTAQNLARDVYVAAKALNDAVHYAHVGGLHVRAELAAAMPLTKPAIFVAVSIPVSASGMVESGLLTVVGVDFRKGGGDFA